MKLFGKEIPVDKVNFVTNVISFVLGVIFFVRMQYKWNEAPPAPVINIPERDSLIAVQSRVNTQLNEIKKVQDSIIKTIRRNEDALNKQELLIKNKRRTLMSTITSDWDDMSHRAQDTYIDKVLSNKK